MDKKFNLNYFNLHKYATFFLFLFFSFIYSRGYFTSSEIKNSVIIGLIGRCGVDLYFYLRGDSHHIMIFDIYMINIVILLLLFFYL